VSKLSFGFLVLAVAMAAIAPGLAAAGPTLVPANVPYDSEGVIPENVVRECTRLGTKIATFTKQYADKNGTPVELVDEIDFGTAPSALRVEIFNVVSSGNAFIGHNKSMSVRVELLSGGEVKAKTSLSRNSMGGFGAGFKGSCSVLGRVTKALGQDIADWLSQQQR
jgi:hypothetical protein